MSTVVTATDLEITVDDTEAGTLVRLRGRLNIDSSPALRDQLMAVLRGQSTRGVVVDMTGVSYIDASGIATLVEGLKIARNCGHDLCLKGLQSRVLHLFESTGLLNLFEKKSCSGIFSASKAS
jgi:anti-sigma B factor antagonist